MRKFWLSFFAAIPVGLLVLSGMTALHPVADSLAVFRLPLAVLSMVSAAVLWPLWPRRVGLMVLALALASSGAILNSMRAREPLPAPMFKFYQKNLSFRMENLSPLVQDIKRRAPDFLTLQEVTSDNKDLLAQLQDLLPTQLYCDFASVGGVALATRFPAVPDSAVCNTKDGMAALQVLTPQGPVWLVSLHLRWPYPYGQAQQVARLLPELANLNGPVFLGGDFNMVPWSKTMALIEQATGSQRVGHSNGTFRLKGMFNMPIDHVLVPAGYSGTVASLAKFGSDHQGVEARIIVAPQTP